MAVMDPEKDKKSTFTNCFVQDLTAAAKSMKHTAKETSVPASATEGQSFVLDFGRPVAINEFKLKEDVVSEISRYIIEYWDNKKADWVSCFNGLGIGAEFIAAIVPRTTSKVRLSVLANSKEKAIITAFEAYNDPSGEPLDVAKGTATPNRVGK